MNRIVCVLAVGVVLLSTSGAAQDMKPAQEAKPTQEMKPVLEGKIEHQTNFSPAEMNKMWQEFSQDKAWMALMKEVKDKGFERRREEKSSWGFRGVQVGPKEMRSEVTLCLFDFMRKGSKEKLSMLWAQRGNERYKAYIVTPEGKEWASSDEWYVDKDFKVQRAHSWIRCFDAALSRDCGKLCLKSIGPCLVVGATGEAAAGAGVAAFVGCVAVICGGCVTFAAIACAFAR